jgi:hypothetical protein
VEATVVLSGGRQGTASVARLWTDGDGAVVPDPPPPASFAVEGGQVPAGSVTVRGNGCPPDAEVVLTVNGARVGTTRADADGAYRAAVSTPPEVGRHEVVARCGHVQVTQPVDVVVPTSASRTAPAEATTAMAVFGFFVLLGGQFLRFSDGYVAGS